MTRRPLFRDHQPYKVCDAPTRRCLEMEFRLKNWGVPHSLTCEAPSGLLHEAAL
ncbi:hypothetical protein M2281_002861 [Mesorhizobium soli]|jgi:hypothetical protein|nr:hypothetical protein [Mesorhizobium soli]